MDDWIAIVRAIGDLMYFAAALIVLRTSVTGRTDRSGDGEGPAD